MLGKEKSDAARVKSKINVYLNRSTSEKQSQLKHLQQQEELLDRKIRDISVRQQYESERSQSRFTQDRSKSPMRKNLSIYSSSPLLGESEFSKIVPKPLPPPSMSSLLDEGKKRSISPERKLLGTYNTKEIVDQLIIKNYEDAHKQAWLTLKDTETIDRPKSTYAEITELLSTGKSISKDPPKSHSLYNELLKKKYGVIQPRSLK